jgi:hypothetical protein
MNGAFALAVCASAIGFIVGAVGLVLVAFLE